MTQVTSALVYLFVNRIEFEGKVNYIATLLHFDSEALDVKEEEEGKVLDEICTLVILAVAFVVLIALMETELTVSTVKQSNKENHTFNFRTGFFPCDKKSVKETKPKAPLSTFLKAINLKKEAELVTGSNTSQVFHVFDKLNDIVGIFKPYTKVLPDERSETLVLSTKQQIVNEVVAYKFDQLSSATQANVPETKHVKLPGALFNTKDSVYGSIQKFASNTESCEDFGSNMFSTADVHRIGLLDLKILNCDRHTANILLDTQTKNLIPIDHALSFPEIQLTNSQEENLTLANISFDWMLFKQAKEPFSQEMMQEILELDINKHLRVLREHKMSLKQQLAVFCGLTVLKEGVKKNLTLHDIGLIIQRQQNRKSASILEQLVKEAVATVDYTKLELNDLKEKKHFFQRFQIAVINYLNKNENL